MNTIPDRLAIAYRTPAIGPFVTFIVNKLLAKVSRREYVNAGDMLMMGDDLFLSFVDRGRVQHA